MTVPSSPTSLEGARHEAVRQAQLRAVGTAFLRARPLVVLPGMVVTLAALAYAHVPPRQLAVLALGMTTALLFFWFERWRGARAAVTERWLARSLLATLAVLGAMAFATGALASPVVPLLLAPTVVAFAAFGGDGRARAALLAALAVILGLALVPVGVPFAPLPRQAFVPAAVGAMATTLALTWIGVGGITRSYRRAAAALDGMRRDAIDEAAVRTRSLEAVGAKVAHEIKNPLASIKGLVQLVARGLGTDDKARQRLGVAESEIVRLEQILADYLSFARPLDDLRPGEVDVRALVDAVAEAAEARLGDKGLRLDVVGDPGTVVADGRRLREALTNVVLNAIEVSPAGASIRLVLARRGQDAVIEVVDDGPGMSADVLARAGEPFFSTRVEGHGLGLVVARTALRQHGGTLDIRSEVGRGTVVTLAIPPFPGGGSQAP